MAVDSVSDGVAVLVAVDAPQHSGLPRPLSYRHDAPIPPGTMVRVPLGRRDVLGIVWPWADAEADRAAAQPSPADGLPAGAPSDLKAVREVLSGVPPLPPRWLELVEFAASYYQ